MTKLWRCLFHCTCWHLSALAPTTFLLSWPFIAHQIKKPFFAHQIKTIAQHLREVTPAVVCIVVAKLDIFNFTSLRAVVSGVLCSDLEKSRKSSNRSYCTVSVGGCSHIMSYHMLGLLSILCLRLSLCCLCPCLCHWKKASEMLVAPRISECFDLL